MMEDIRWALLAEHPAVSELYGETCELQERIEKLEEELKLLREINKRRRVRWRRR